MQHAKQLKFARWMVVSIWLLLVAATALPLLHAWRTPSYTPRAGAAATLFPDRIVLQLREPTPQNVAALNAQFNLNLQPNSPQSTLMTATVPPSRRDAIIQRLEHDNRIEAIEPLAKYFLPEPVKVSIDDAAPQTRPTAKPSRGWKPNDERYDEQWNFHMIGAEKAWTRSRGKGITVAVIDTGVALHDSPNGKRSRDFGQTQSVAGYNYIEKNDETYDDLGHGTHVAGTIAESTNNREGVAGLAFESRIMPLKVFGTRGFCTSADIADAIRFATNNGARVINMSLGGPEPSRVMHNAIRRARRHGVLVVCSAGNGFGEPVGYPAAFRESVAVSSVGPSGDMAFYSSYGPEVNLAAPGGDTQAGGPSGGVLQNTVIDEAFGGKGDDYYHLQGTSMAAPHVAAVSALVMAQGIDDEARVRDIMLRSTTPQQPKLQFGTGILSADGATALAAKMERHQMLSKVLWLVVAMLVFLGIRDTSNRRAGLALAFLCGALWPEMGSKYFGVDAPQNLISYSALLPFLLFWELEEGFASRMVSALAWGVALSLGTSLILEGLTPLTPSTFGTALLPWTLANTLSAALIGVLAAVRSRAR